MNSDVSTGLITRAVKHERRYRSNSLAKQRSKGERLKAQVDKVSRLLRPLGGTEESRAEQGTATICRRTRVAWRRATMQGMQPRIFFPPFYYSPHSAEDEHAATKSNILILGRDPNLWHEASRFDTSVEIGKSENFIVILLYFISLAKGCDIV